MSELKPCPFCGGKAKLIEIQEVGCFRVLCEDCPTSVGRYWYYKKQDAIKAWNRRVHNSNDFDTQKDDFSKEGGQ